VAKPLNVVWADRAEHQFVDIIDFIAARNFDAAVRLRDRAIEALDRLGSFPDSGRRVPEFARNGYLNRAYREVVVPPLRIVYRLADGRVEIVYVLRAEQRFDPDQLA